MNRGFGFYFGHAIKSSCQTLWHKGNLLKYFAWVVMKILSPFTLVLGAMFSLADVRQAKIAQRENVIDIPQSFKVACRAKPFGAMLLAGVLEALIFLAGVILIAVASALLGAIGFVITLFVDTVAPMIIILAFLAPGMLVLLVYCIIMPILFAPTAYVIETNPDVGAADAISICFNTMKSRGKFTYFLNCFIPALVEGAILGLGVVVELMLSLFIEDAQLSLLLMVLVGLIFVVGFTLVAPMFALARKISNTSLFEDIVLDPVNASKRTNGVNIKNCKGVKFDPAEYENELSILFDETYSDRVPVPENPAAARKRALEERKAARERSIAYEQSLKAATPASASAPNYGAADKSDEEEDGELLTVSDLIRDVEEAEKAAPAAEAATPVEQPAAEPVPVEPAPAAQPEPVAQPEKVAQAEEVKEAVPVTPEKEEAATPVEKPEEKSAAAEPVAEAPEKAVQPEKPEPVKSEPVKKTATKTTVKATAKVAEKPASKTTTATKSTTAAKTTTKAATTKTATAAKPAATKTTATVKAKAAEKPAAVKTTATVKAKTTTKKAAEKPEDGAAK